MPEIHDISWLYPSLLIIAFFMWYNFSQLFPAQFPCIVVLDPVWHPAGHPAHHLCHQVRDFWHSISFLVLDVMRHLPALRVPERCPLPENEFLGSDICSVQVIWTQITCCVLLWSLVEHWDSGVAATEQTCHGWPNQQQIKNQLTGFLTLSLIVFRTKIAFPTLNIWV